MTRATAVEAAALGKGFKGRRVLDGIDLSIGSGQIAVLLGPNGAGKSTFLRILATTVTPDSGTVVVAGHDVEREADAVRRSVGVMMGEERGWYWRISARRNLEFFGVMAGATRQQIRTRGEELLVSVGLAEHADRTVGTFSSGMRARLGLARALLMQPPVLLLDEPSSHLDPVAAADLRVRLRAVAGEGATVVIATHDLHEAAEIGDRVIGLVAGRVAFEAAPGETAAQLEARLVGAA